jgi:hypothetical protein
MRYAMAHMGPLRILIYQGLWNRRKAIDAGDADCEIWHDRSKWADADAVVFHLPQLCESRFPPRKLPGQVWVAWSKESEANYPMLARRAELHAVFDLWMTYQHDSDVWCPYFGPHSIAELKTAPVEKSEARLAVAFVSNPHDLNGRAELLDELMQEMPVDSYGKVHRNAPCLPMQGTRPSFRRSRATSSPSPSKTPPVWTT